VSAILTRFADLASFTQGKSRMRASRTSGSVEGVLSDGHPYSDSRNGPSDKPGTVQPVERVITMAWNE